jgi:predicted hotdog family 3-hydroxylacyl-ACP dehydratase
MSVAIENLIPQRAPMRWIDALTHCAEKNGSATTTFDAEHFAVHDDEVLEIALVECVAQAAAAILSQNALNAGKSGAVAKGMLVAVSNFKIHSRPPLGKNLQIEVNERKRLGSLRMISGTISCDGQTLAAGELMVYA